ncbi:MAG: anthranilate phosphoribosyltransferase [Planctomycetota bacterium]
MNEIDTLIRGGRLGEGATEAIFARLMAGELDDAQIGALLALLQHGGPTVDEVVGGARVMRAKVERVPFEPTGDQRLIDTCGTGGAPKTFNVSTAAAIVAAAAADGRVRVAKHGNRSRTGRGSAEVLGALGVNVDASVETQAACLREVGVCFCFAIHHHPAMRHVIGPRKSLGVPTIFNVLGPLTNPAGAKRQLIGVYAPHLVDLVSGALARLGTDRAIVMHSREGLDEIGLAGVTDAAVVDGNTIERMEIEPARLGLASVSHERLVVDDVAESAKVIRRVLAGEAGGPRDMVVVNAAAALFVAGVCDSVERGVPMAQEAIDSGRAAEVLAQLASRSHAE